MPLSSDRALLEAFRRGEEAALTRVYHAHFDDLVDTLARGIRVRHGGGTSWLRLAPSDLEAVVQESFARAFSPKTRLAYDGLRPFSGWLLSIARHTALDLARRRGVGGEPVPLEEEQASLTAEGPDPEQQALDREQTGLVRRFLAGLPEDQVALAQARFMEGLAQEAVAARLGLTRAQVRLREERLREAFVQFLSDAGWVGAGAAAILFALALSALTGGGGP